MPDALVCPRATSLALWLSFVGTSLRRAGGLVCALRLLWTQFLARPLKLPLLLVNLARASYLAVRMPRSLRHIHAYSAGSAATVGLFLAEILGQGFSFAAHTHEFFTGEARFLDDKLREAEFVTVCTAHAREALLRQHPLATKGRVHLVYHGVDERQCIPAELYPRPPHLLLSLGPLAERSGYEILLRAASVLRSRGAEFRLVIMGDGPERMDLMSLTTGLALQEVVEFQRPVWGRERQLMLSRAAVYVWPGVVAADGDRAGLPVALREALGCGVPVVATEVGATPEVVHHEVTGLLARPGDPESLADQLERMLYDEALRARVAVAGRELVHQRLRLEQTVSRMAELLGR
jgi:glycosyltransferase involved in cell wall biosynthesis